MGLYILQYFINKVLFTFIFDTIVSIIRNHHKAFDCAILNTFNFYSPKGTFDMETFLIFVSNLVVPCFTEIFLLYKLKETQDILDT